MLTDAQLNVQYYRSWTGNDGASNADSLFHIFDVKFDGNILFVCGERIPNAFSSYHAISIRYNLDTNSFDGYLSVYGSANKASILYSNGIIGSKYIALSVSNDLIISNNYLHGITLVSAYRCAITCDDCSVG